MKLLSLKILSDFRNLKGVELKFNAKSKTYVLIGNNGSGKSSLLEAVSSIFYHLYDGSQEAIEFNFTLAYKFEGHTVSIAKKEEKVVKMTVDRNPVGHTELDPYLPQRVVCNYSGEEMRIKDLYYEPLRSQQERRLRSAAGFSPLRMVFVDKDLWKIIFYVMIAQRGRHTSFDRFFQETLKINSIDRIELHIDGKALETWRKYPNPVSDYMQRLYARVRPDGTIDIADLNPDDDEALTMYNNLSSGRSLIDLNIVFNGGVDSQYLSEGEKKLMVVLFILEVISDERSLVLLDEPDSHIHVARKQEMADLFKEASNRENVLTSHSPTLTAAFCSENIIMLDRTDDGYAQVVKADKQQVVSTLTNGIWSLQRQNIFLASNNDIVLVEGESDEVFLNKAFYILQHKGLFVGRKYEYLPCGGADGVALLKSHFTPKAGQFMFCFFDSDTAGWKSINSIFGVAEGHYNTSNFTRARKIDNIWVAPYPKSKKNIKEFNIEDYFGRRKLMHYVLKFRSLNEVPTKDAIKRAMSRDCQANDIKEEYYKRFELVFKLIEDIKVADAAGYSTLD